jgi:hypothetical protein
MGLIIAATITTALALVGLALLLARAADWRPLALAFAVALPLQPLAFYALRLPLDGLLKTSFGMVSWVVIVSLFYAPLTEEPAKWLAALVPPVRRAIGSAPVSVALAVGLGFAIGEIWFLAIALARSSSYPDLPFYLFGGFFIERLEVCFLHGAMVAPAFVALARRRRFWLGALAGVALHFFLNFPIYLAQIDLLGLGREVWTQLLLLWMLAYVIAGAFLLRWLGCKAGHEVRRSAPAHPGAPPPLD